MLRTILAASALTIGLATAAMAQNAGSMDNGGMAGSGQSVTVDPATPANPGVDESTTGSIYGGPAYNDGMNSNADRNCAPGPQGAQPDANHLSPGSGTPAVNDNHCGK